MLLSFFLFLKKKILVSQAQNANLRRQLDGTAKEGEAYTEKDDEIIFLRRRLDNIRYYVEELERAMAPPLSPTRGVPTPPTGKSPAQKPMDASESAFPGVKLRRETVLSKNKLAVTAVPSKLDEEGSSSDINAEKKKGSFFRKK